LFFAGSPNPSCNFLSFLRNVPLRIVSCSDYRAISSDALGFSIDFWGLSFCRSVDREVVVVDMGQIQYSEKYFDDTYEYR
jgi:hypothetical protein